MNKQEAQELREWFIRNEAHLRDYSLQEVLNLANACGFKATDLYVDVYTWIEKSRCKLKLWESPFFEKWVRAYLAQLGKDE